MHSTSAGSSHIERGSGLPGMWQPLWPRLQQLQQLRLILLPVPLPVLLLIGKQQPWRVEQNCKAKMGASRLVRVVYACRSASAHAGAGER